MRFVIKPGTNDKLNESVKVHVFPDYTDLVKKTTVSLGDRGWFGYSVMVTEACRKVILYELQTPVCR